MGMGEKNLMRTETATQAKVHFGEILEAATREPILIQKSGRNLAVILPYDEYQRILELEDEYWLLAANQAKAEGMLSAEESSHFLEKLFNAKATTE